MICRRLFSNVEAADLSWLRHHCYALIAFIALGTVSASSAIKLFSEIGNKQSFNLRANKQFNKVADKLNKAIKAANQ